MRPIDSGQHDVDHSDVATGRGAFNLSSSISVREEEPPLTETSLYCYRFGFTFIAYTI
ncbi:hypothetical protein [Rummeliibacillus sp. SL167]|uniref:hypothetical protein n=1 Tax=Rummeliibacillus sp. SL167 TaxID=2579792 RepID=UPI001644601C|nr:hypothetical protein [Rummeliibacillus sp. SL167]